MGKRLSRMIQGTAEVGHPASHLRARKRRGKTKRLSDVTEGSRKEKGYRSYSQNHAEEFEGGLTWHRGN